MQFLLSKNLMDYSMLVGVERRVEGDRDSFGSDDDISVDIEDFEFLDED